MRRPQAGECDEIAVLAVHAGDAVVLVPARAIGGGDALAALVGTVFVQILVVVIPLVFGTGLVAQDAEARTLVYLLTRPLSRASLLLGKFAGAWAAATVLLWASLAATAAILLGIDGFAGAAHWGAILPRVAQRS